MNPMRAFLLLGLSFLGIIGSPHISKAVSSSAKDVHLERFLKRARNSDHCQVERVYPDSTDSVAIPHSRPKRGIAIALTVLLGPLGGHRLYLGTDPQVPVLYTVTLGGGLGLLPLIDLIQLIVAEDMESFLNNKKVFMWQGGEEEEKNEEE